MSNWKDIDPDDIPGYLLDDLRTIFDDGDGKIIETRTLEVRNSDKKWTWDLLVSLRNALEAYYA